MQISLPALAKRLQERERQLEGLKSLALDGIRDVAIVAIQHGQDLLFAKDTLGPEWREQLTAQGYQGQEHLIDGYMRLASKVRDLNELSDPNKYKQALLSCGLLPEPDGATHEPSQKPADTFLRHVNRVVQLFNQATTELPIARWDSTRKQMAKQQLEPLVKIYGQL